MTPAIVHYTDHHYGQFDDKGVSMNGFGKYANYYPINIAQYGFILHDMYIKDKSDKDVEEVLFACLDWFESNKDDILILFVGDVHTITLNMICKRLKVFSNGSRRNYFFLSKNVLLFKKK